MDCAFEGFRHRDVNEIHIRPVAELAEACPNKNMAGIAPPAEMLNPITVEIKTQNQRL
jgi:hypothetical protein